MPIIPALWWLSCLASWSADYSCEPLGRRAGLDLASQPASAPGRSRPRTYNKAAHQPSPLPTWPADATPLGAGSDVPSRSPGNSGFKVAPLPGRPRKWQRTFVQLCLTRPTGQRLGRRYRIGASPIATGSNSTIERFLPSLRPDADHALGLPRSTAAAKTWMSRGRSARSCEPAARDQGTGPSCHSPSR